MNEPATQHQTIERIHMTAGAVLRPSFSGCSRLRWPSEAAQYGLRLRLATRALGGDKTGPSPVDRSKAGCKHHLITDTNGVPLACLLTGANRPDITQLLPPFAAWVKLARGKVSMGRRWGG